MFIIGKLNVICLIVILNKKCFVFLCGVLEFYGKVKYVFNCVYNGFKKEICINMKMSVN